MKQTTKHTKFAKMMFFSLKATLINHKITSTSFTRINENICFLRNAIDNDDMNAVNHFVYDIIYSSVGNVRKSDPMIQKITLYIQENYSQNLSLDLLASIFNISKQWLISCFKKEMHTTPIVYLNNYRMRKAKELLLKQELSVGEIAIACGFETPYYFSNTFKKFFGISPKAWRKNMLL